MSTDPSQETPRTTLRAAAAVGAVTLGLASLAAGVALDRRERAVVATWVRTTGVVVDADASGAVGGRATRPVVEFSREGHTVRFQTIDQRSSSRLAVGVRVPVLYDPRHPAQAVVDGGESPNFLLCFGVNGLVCVGLGVALWRGRRAAG